MRTILVLLVGLILVGCSSNNIAKNKTTISNMSDFLKVNEAVCSKYKSSDSKIYGCGTSTSKSFELAKSKALLQAKVLVSDSLSNSLIKNESQTIKEDTKKEEQSEDKKKKEADLVAEPTGKSVKWKDTIKSVRNYFPISKRQIRFFK